MKKYFKYIGISIVGILALIPVVIFGLFLASYYLEKPVEQPPQKYYQVEPSGRTGGEGAYFPKSTQQQVIYPQQRDNYYTPFIMPGPPGSNLYYISRPDGGYDQATGPQIK